MTTVAPQVTQQDRAPAGWDLYFESEDYSPQDRRAQLISELISHFRDHEAKAELIASTSFPQEGSCVVTVSMDRLISACRSGDLEAAIECQPLEGMACLAAAAFEV